jgi:hypothetical protein
MNGFKSGCASSENGDFESCARLSQPGMGIAAASMNQRSGFLNAVSSRGKPAGQSRRGRGEISTRFRVGKLRAGWTGGYDPR